MTQQNDFHRWSKPWLIVFVLISIFYWLWFSTMIGIKPINVYFYVILVGLFFINKKSRQLLLAFSPFFIYLLCYDSLRILHHYNPFPIHIQDLYDLEKSFLGFNYEGERIIANEFFIKNTNTFSDIFSGIFYISWVPLPIIITLFFFFKGKAELSYHFWLAFLFANLLGFIGYIVYPAAPPWYFFEYGNDLIMNTGGSAAGLARFDDIIGFDLYKNMYSQGSNTFGAMPSMHAAFPMLLTYFSRKSGYLSIVIIAFISLVGIWYGAVYSLHHYILDIIFGILCGIIALIVTESLINRKFAFTWYDNTINFLR